MDGQLSHGLFKDWFDKINKDLKSSGRVRGVTDKFARLKSDRERVKFVLDLDVFQKHVIITPSLQKKSKEEAVKYRNEGNVFFKKKLEIKALQRYTDSILSAPNTENEPSCNDILALGFANRSAVLFNLEKYKLCIQDIEAAFENGYPLNLSYKLYFRKAKCLFGQGDASQGKLASIKARESLQYSDLDENKREKLLREIEKTERNLDVQVKKGTPSVDKGIPGVSLGKHETFIAASGAFGIESSPEKGRYVVAQQDLQPGDVVLVERPFSAVLLPEQYQSHCHHCFVHLDTSFPCYMCTSVRFCSPKCSNDAWRTYHKYECRCLTLLVKANVGKFGLLAMRCVSGQSSDSVLTFTQQIPEFEEQSEEALVRNADGQYHPMDYSAIYNLVTHTRDRTTEDLFWRSVQAAFLTKCLEFSDYFSSEKLPDRGGHLAIIGGLILRHLQLLPCNAHEISQLELDRSSVATSVSVEVGAGIYATLSLFNHSCDPTVTRNFYGDACVVRAIKNIRKGEEISDNYGAVYAVQSLQERQAKLQSQYYFKCCCEPCERDWPLYQEIPTGISEIIWLCSECKHPLQIVSLSSQSKVCGYCGHVNHIDTVRGKYVKSEEKYGQAFDALLSCDVASALPVLERHLSFICSNIRLPWREYCNCQEALKQCYCILGNCFTN